jgi:hypothetical protein
MDKKSLKSLRAKLPRGYTITLAVQTGFSQPFVSQVMHGNRSNPTIIAAAITLAKIEQARVKAISEEINSI